MPVYIRKHPLEIPLPSEKDWIKEDEEENFFLQDPDQTRDQLPQPFRMINKMVNLVFDQALEIIEQREALREAQKLKVQPTQYMPTGDFKVAGRANCLAASGKNIFVGTSTGLAAFSAADCRRVCAWEAAKLEICAIHASDLRNENHVLIALDEMGFAYLFYFCKDSLLLVKVLNEVEDISKRSTCEEVELSRGGSYAGVLLQGSTEAWLEIYRLPKESWERETENAPGAAAAAAPAVQERMFSQASEMKSLELQREGSAEMETRMSTSKLGARLSHPMLLLKVRPPKPLSGSIFKSPLDALMKIDDGSVLGLGHNHMIKDCQLEQQDAIFHSTFKTYLERDSESDSKEETPRHAMFHFILPGRILQMGPEIKSQPEVPAGISVHWSGSHNLCLYLLTRPLKEKGDTELKPDAVWPCAALIICSAVSSCSSYLALACEDSTITVWNNCLGSPLGVTALPEGCLIRSIHFLPSVAAPKDQGLCPNGDPAHPNMQLLALCGDGSLHLVAASWTGQSNTVLLAGRPEDPGQTITTVAPLLTFNGKVLVFSRDGTVSLIDTAMLQTICHLVTPPSYTVASPWQPVFALDTENQHLLLQGQEQQQADAVSQGKDSQSTIFLFDFNSHLLRDVFPKKLESPPESLQHLPWDKRCDIFLRNRQEHLLGLSQQIPGCWSQLQKYAATLQKERQKK
ncbi:PREDICTED: WD repeat-containing protein 93 [Gavialis gangeticus]|uniref:WD repeat-containing protein 93 n=1 Tax=Gavialis gangeticus TaxID=94835 RepID=UPI00092FB18E|nr:PREDICTED: WD repeat-containing protein 93 [Gavialis gangeticus]XP_019359631.1 PREDICTED: WD repeat-containing protein 93 [Gavialis gangeticus]